MRYIRGRRTLPLRGFGKSILVSFFLASRRFVVFGSAFQIRSSFLARGLHLLSRHRESPRIEKQNPRLYCQRATDPVSNYVRRIFRPGSGTGTSTEKHHPSYNRRGVYYTPLRRASGVFRKSATNCRNGSISGDGSSVRISESRSQIPADWQLNCQSAGIVLPLPHGK